MDFALNEQQEMLKKSAREFLLARYPEKVLQEVAKNDADIISELWQQMADLGWTSLAIPETYGGIGDFLDLSMVLEEMGRVCFISPFFATVVLGAGVIAAAGSEEQKQKLLPAVAEGKTVLTLALMEPGLSFEPEGVLATAEAKGGKYIINGTKLFVLDANAADFIITAARTAKTPDLKSGISLFIIDRRASGVTTSLLKTLGGGKQYEVKFTDINVSEADLLGDINQGWGYLEKVIDAAVVARCAEMVGGTQQVLDMTVTYAKDRIAFDHPIGAFQAIQHRSADMLMDVEGARYLTYEAAWRISRGLPFAKEAAAAKAWVSQAFLRAVTSAHQIHGAIGFTDDHVLHHYTKRARTYEQSFGDSEFYWAKLAGLIKNNQQVNKKVI